MITHDVDNSQLQTDFIPFYVFELRSTPMNSNPLKLQPPANSKQFSFPFRSFFI